VNGFWFLVRGVPAEFAAYDTRKLVRQSTGIRIVDDPRGVRAGAQDGLLGVTNGVTYSCPRPVEAARPHNESKQQNLPPIFDRVRIRGGKDNQRVAFAPAFVQEQILADGMFDDLNPEARRVIYVIVETGLRLSEAVNLSRETIRLKAAVPHLSVAPEGRHIKTDESRREIPLVGVALMAMRVQPDGFPRYRDRLMFCLRS
jgi:hypothetical protein